MTDQTTPSAPSPDTVVSLLRHFGWVPQGSNNVALERWRTQGSDRTIVIPRDPGTDDYEELLTRAQRALVFEYGSEASRVTDLLTLRTETRMELTHWKKETAQRLGLIGWEEGESLYSAARATLQASAKSTREARAYHGKSSAYVARRFLEQTYMGQTEVGSFVITAHTLADARFHFSKGSEENATDPRRSESVSGRDIVSTFANALAAVRSGLDDYKNNPTTEHFVDGVDSGVSHEFAKALSELTAGGDAAVEITRHPAPGVQGRTVEVAFDAVESSVLAKVATRLIQDRAPEYVSLAGEVTLLSHSSTDPVHVIRLAMPGPGAIRKVRIRLSPEQYKIAIDAHSSDSLLAVTGKLERESQFNWMYDPDSVRAEKRRDELPPLTEQQAFDLDLLGESSAMSAFQDDDVV